jgi:hypothetical protein
MRVVGCERFPAPYDSHFEAPLDLSLARASLPVANNDCETTPSQLIWCLGHHVVSDYEHGLV